MPRIKDVMAKFLDLDKKVFTLINHDFLRKEKIFLAERNIFNAIFI